MHVAAVYGGLTGDSNGDLSESHEGPSMCISILKWFLPNGAEDSWTHTYQYLVIAHLHPTDWQWLDILPTLLILTGHVQYAWYVRVDQLNDATQFGWEQMGFTLFRHSRGFSGLNAWVMVKVRVRHSIYEVKVRFRHKTQLIRSSSSAEWGM